MLLYRFGPINAAGINLVDVERPERRLFARFSKTLKAFSPAGDDRYVLLDIAGSEASRASDRDARSD